VAKENIFEEYKYDNTGSRPCWVCESDASLRIENNSIVRVKLCGTKIDENEIFAIGTIKDDYLGPIKA
jgi:DNA-directed RNA polymerase II subunit RPB7